MKKFFIIILTLFTISHSLSARYFDPEMGRFTSRDPVGYKDGMNLYPGYFAQRFDLDPSGTMKVSDLADMFQWDGNGSIGIRDVFWGFDVKLLKVDLIREYAIGFKNVCTGENVKGRLGDDKYINTLYDDTKNDTFRKNFNHKIFGWAAGGIKIDCCLRAVLLAKLTVDITAEWQTLPHTLSSTLDKFEEEILKDPAVKYPKDPPEGFVHWRVTLHEFRKGRKEAGKSLDEAFEELKKQYFSGDGGGVKEWHGQNGSVFGVTGGMGPLEKADLTDFQEWIND